jgi:alpha-tubulin suppressor-like RCC1 family protein
VWAWGVNDLQQLGHVTSETCPSLNGRIACSPTPVVAVHSSVAKLGTRMAAISAGMNHALALTETGIVVSWGAGPLGELGTGTNVNSATPAIVLTMDSGGVAQALTGITAIAAGDHYSLALQSNGIIWSWGTNELGQLGDGTTNNRNQAVRVVDGHGGLLKASFIAAGEETSYALSPAK